MRRIEDIVKVLELCAEEDIACCDECPYENKCQIMKADAAALIKELKAKLDNMSQPTAMPNYEAMYYDLNREISCLKTEIDVMREELIYLRAVKATTEAFLGREIK